MARQRRNEIVAEKNLPGGNTKVITGNPSTARRQFGNARDTHGLQGKSVDMSCWAGALCPSGYEMYLRGTRFEIPQRIS